MNSVARMARCAVWTLAGLLLCSAIPALAHKGSDAYLDVREVSLTDGSAPADSSPARALRFTLSVALRDLDVLLPVDANADGRVTWGEVKAVSPAVQDVLQTTAQLDQSPAGCTLQWAMDGLERRSDGAYLRAAATSSCQGSGTLRFRYTLFAAQDATHRLLITGHFGGRDLLSTASPQQVDSVVLRASSGSNVSGQASSAPAEASERSPWSTLVDYLLLGMHHLLEGYDHLAFLLALVLPLRLVLGMRESGPWWALLRTVTAFTVGHSITLVMATLGWSEASPRWVEPVIALSIAVTAVLNIYPVPRLRMEYLALGFGMVHGFGFAGLLQEAAAPSGLLLWALAGFNLGVEAGQLLAVSGWVLAVQLVVRQPWYASIVVRGGSLLLTLLALAWFAQRVV